MKAMRGTQHKRNGAQGKKARQERALERIEQHRATARLRLAENSHAHSLLWREDKERDIARDTVQIETLRGKLGLNE